MSRFAMGRQAGAQIASTLGALLNAPNVEAEARREQEARNLRTAIGHAKLEGLNLGNAAARQRATDLGNIDTQLGAAFGGEGIGATPIAATIMRLSKDPVAGLRTLEQLSQQRQAIGGYGADPALANARVAFSHGKTFTPFATQGGQVINRATGDLGDVTAPGQAQAAASYGQAAASRAMANQRNALTPALVELRQAQATRAAQPRQGLQVRTLPDGTQEVSLGGDAPAPAGARAELDKTGARKALQEIQDIDRNLADFQSISSAFGADLLTIQSKGMAAVMATASRFGPVGEKTLKQALTLIPGAPSFEEVRSVLRRRTLLAGQVKRNFNAYRKAITGAAASAQELQMLEQAMFNMDQSPEEFSIMLQSMFDEMSRRRQQLADAVQNGVPLAQARAQLKTMPLEWQGGGGELIPAGGAPAMAPIQPQAPAPTPVQAQSSQLVAPPQGSQPGNFGAGLLPPETLQRIDADPRTPQQWTDQELWQLFGGAQ